MNNFINTIPIGTKLNGKVYQYEIVKVLGQGSFGVTYLASVKISGDLGSIDAFVAIKEFFMSEINGRDGLTVTTSNQSGLFNKYKCKFIKESQNLAKLKHQNIIKVLESFEANNTVYYVMDFIEGGSLDEYISHKGCLSEEEAIAISYQILDALAYMHSKNMLHLDLKPSNIMMNKGKPVLIDFGLSKQYDDDGNAETSTTIGAGTPGYSPIEQSNFSGEISESNGLPVTMDIYALGATIFKMLTGKKPPVASIILNMGFPNDELDSRNISEKARNVVEQLMSPVRKNRPQSDQAVKCLLDNLSKDHSEFTEISENINVLDIDISDNDYIDKKKSKFNWKVFKYALILLCAITTILFIFIILKNDFLINRSTITENVAVPIETDQLSTNLEQQSNILDRKELPNIEYSISGNTEFGSENSRLCATINGEEVVIGSINYIFGPNNMGFMDIFDQQDYNGDGIRDVMVCDVNIGTAGGSTWAVITYAGDNTFEKSNLISEASYYQKEISYVNGQAVLDFITIDMGERIVKERYGLKNGSLVSLDLPKSKSQAYSILKSVNMEELGESGSFYFDLNGDGISEKITTTGSYHFGRSFAFTINGHDYEFNVSNALWGVGTLHVLKAKTNGFHDIMIERDTRLVHKWDGSTYISE